MKMPRNHAQRYELNNEVHARPPEWLNAPLRLSCLALTTGWPYRDEDRDIVGELTKQYGATPPGPGVKHYSVDLGGFRLVWERHTEFTRYTFIAPGGEKDIFSNPAIDEAPSAWVERLPGELIVAANAELVDDEAITLDYATIAERYFSGNALVGAAVTGGGAVALTDFRVHKDDFSRFLIVNSSMSPWHAGRIVQRILEIETYRVMALLALPAAQALNPKLADWEASLSALTSRMAERAGADEPDLLNELTILQASIEKSRTETQFRFNAGAAYYDLVQRRNEELREERVSGMQTFSEFTERRLAPAMSTCKAASNRLEALSERVDRAAQLLSTRVDTLLERQNQAVLESMNRRAALQLRLQQTVEGLSVAAITYYVVGVLGYIAAGAEAIGWPVTPKVVMGAAAPAVLILSSLGVWRMRRHVESRADLSERELD